jgi:hypothetical protein
MIDDLIDQAIEKGLERAGVLCTDEARMDAVYERIFTPLIKYLTLRAGWLVYTIECLASLIVLQTVLLVIIIQRLR